MSQTILQKLDDIKTKISQYNSVKSANNLFDIKPNAPLSEIDYTEHTHKFFEYIETSFNDDCKALKNIYAAEEIQNRTYDKKLPNIDDIYIPANLPLDQLTGYNPIRQYAAIKDGHHPNSGEFTLHQIFARELNFVEENQQYLAYSLATLTRIKKAIDAIADGRIADAVTIIRDSKRDDPHNNTLSFLLSQICYYRAINGMTEFLPEARNEGKKSCHFGEEANQYMQRLYRYAYVMCELNFDKDKALELIRNFYLLSPESLLEKDGILTHNALHLKTWLILTKIPIEKWTAFEHDSLSKIAIGAPGGAIFYMKFFRPLFKNKFAEEMEPTIEKYREVEDKITLSKSRYTAIKKTIDTSFAEDGKLNDAPEHLWTLEHRYLRILLGAVQAPNFDQILMHCSLDARRYARNCYQNDALKNAGLPGTNYWQAWCMSITPERSSYSSSVIPVMQVSAAVPVMKACDEMIKVLQEYEQSIIDEEKWEIIKPYMPDYQYQAFIHVSSGPKAFRTPEDPYYLPLFRKWSTQRPEHPMPSIIIHKYAAKGAFSSINEALAAFEGIQKIIDDPTHGLKTRAKSALHVLLQDKEKHQQQAKATARKMLIKSHFNDFWWIYFILLPLVVITFLVMLTSGSTSAAFGNLGFMLMIVGAIGIIFYLLNTRKKQGSEKENESTSSETDDDDLELDFQKLQEVEAQSAQDKK